MSYITTYTGRHFDPTCPEREKIDIRDIAHALSLTCRGNGHVKTFFSVGQHCVHCALEAEARGYSRRLVLACLLHDASECYMSDVPRPVKETMPQYKAVEERLLEQVYIKYLGSSLTDEEEKQVKQIDNDMLYYDLLYLLNEKTEQDAPVMATDFSYEVLSFEQVERSASFPRTVLKFAAAGTARSWWERYPGRSLKIWRSSWVFFSWRSWRKRYPWSFIRI